MTHRWEENFDVSSLVSDDPGFCMRHSAGRECPRAGPAAQPDLAKLAEEAQVWLADLIRINTTNPPGNELAAAKYVAGILQKEGIRNEVLEVAPGRGVVVGRLQAGPLPDAANALLLVAHLDVVGVDASKWTVDPFAAVVRDGYLYGRGSIDDKGMLAANLATIVALKRSAARLSRDIIFLATADEEQGGAASIKLVIEKYWDKIACAYAINEGGRVMLKDGKVQYVGIQTSEKVPYNVTVTATGTSGHASIPRPDNPVVHLAAAIAKLGAYQAPGPAQHDHASVISNSSPRSKMMRSPNGCARWNSPSARTWQ